MVEEIKSERICKVYWHSSIKMKEIKDNCVHLIVTSPPYPMIQKWDSLFKNINFKDQHRFLNKVWKECYRILVDGGICCINIGDATRSIDNNFQCFPNYSQTVISCFNIGFTTLIPILWKKISNRPNAFLGSGMLPPNGYVAQDYEYIAILRKGNLRKFRPKDKNRLRSSFTKKERDLWFQQTWNIQGIKNARKTSAFPQEVPYRLIRMFSLIGDIVVDPFLGSGTTGKTAMSLNRNFIGYEIKKRESILNYLYNRK